MNIPHPLRSRFNLAISVFAFTLSACSNYEVSVNENIVYTPTDLFSDYKIKDQALNTCVKATIKDQKARNIEELHNVFCPPGEIRDLTGLERFTSLKQLGLAENNISNIELIQHLDRLEQVNLAGNNIRDASVFEGKEHLILLDLRNNPTLDCASALTLSSIETLHLPVHCQP